jgi:hypothetical protein
MRTTGSLLGYEGRGSKPISCCCYEYMGVGVGIAMGRTYKWERKAIREKRRC